MRLVVLVGALFGLAFARPAQADETHAWTGVWQGTVGQASIRACFGTRGDPDQGSYYYLRHLRVIRLDPKAGPAWSESGPEIASKAAATWSLKPSSVGALLGTWSQKGVTQPIQLTRLPQPKSEAGEPPCGSMAFVGPRLVKTSISRKPATVDGSGYTQLIFNAGAHLGIGIEAFELPATNVAARRINAALAEHLPAPGGRDTPGYLDCILGSAADFGENGEYQDRVEADLISTHWLSTRRTWGGFCGGAHPDWETNWSVFNRTSGARVDPWSWFAKGVASRRVGGGYEVGPQLAKMLRAKWPRAAADDCGDSFDGIYNWDIHPTREGLAFWPQLPHVIAACADDAVIPYRDLAPLLNPQGQAAMASIIEDVSRLPPKQKRR